MYSPLLRTRWLVFGDLPHFNVHKKPSFHTSSPKENNKVRLTWGWGRKKWEGVLKHWYQHFHEIECSEDSMRQSNVHYGKCIFKYTEGALHQKCSYNSVTDKKHFLYNGCSMLSGALSRWEHHYQVSNYIRSCECLVSDVIVSRGLFVWLRTC